MIDLDFFRELDRFSFMMRKRVSTVYTGTRRSIRQGRGIGVVGYREYMYGDDFKSIDWKVYGRTEKLYIRQYEEEKNITAHILLDASKSMDYGDKFDYAARLAVGFAYMVMKENEKFGISTFSGDVDIVKPVRGIRHLMGFIEHLNSLEPGGVTRVGESVARYIQMIKSRSLVVLISDFLDSLDSVREGIYRLSRNDLVVVQVLDRDEWDFPAMGDVRLHDLEGGGVIRTYISPRFREEYLRRLRGHIEGIREACNSVGADFYSFRTDKPIFEAFAEAVAR